MTYEEVNFLVGIAERSARDDMFFKKIEMFFKNLSNEGKKNLIKEENISEFVLDEIIKQAKNNRLNIYFQNILCMA